jgi:glutathione S-transferase
VSDFKFFYASGACSLAPHILLLEVGAQPEMVKLDLKAGDQHKDEYKQINPLGRVPAIATKRGVLTENPAVLGWIARAWPNARLAPLEDPWAMSQVNSFNNFISSSVHVAFAHMFRPERYGEGEAAAEAMKARAPELLDSYFQMIEDKLGDHPFVHGENYTISDPYLYVMSRWFQRPGMGHPEKFEKVRAHLDRMQARDGVKRALEAEGLEPV